MAAGHRLGGNPGRTFPLSERREADAADLLHLTLYITNAQFQAFIDDPKGYGNPRWWEGLTERFEQPEAPWWSYANHPRESVSWYEAMAFCTWLSERLGTEVRLPTEQEWEKAARGTNGNEYPWGKDYISGFANINETWDKAVEHYLRRTTVVGLYPQGRSPYGVMDLAGGL